MLRILDYRTTNYILRAGLYKQKGKIIDTKPGKIIVERGILNKTRKIYSTFNYISVTLNQSLIGRLKNYGNLVLRQKDKKKGKPLILKSVKDPIKYQKVIQNMIDYETGKQPSIINN